MVKLSTERFLPGLSRVKISKQYAEYKLSKQGFSISSLWRDVGEGDGRSPPSKELSSSAHYMSRFCDLATMFEAVRALD